MPAASHEAVFVIFVTRERRATMTRAAATAKESGIGQAEWRSRGDDSNAPRPIDIGPARARDTTEARLARGAARSRQHLHGGKWDRRSSFAATRLPARRSMKRVFFRPIADKRRDNDDPFS